jgi:hypothetical protein
MDRRALFFLGAAFVCALLIAPTDAHLRWVPITMSIAYAFLAVMSYFDFRERRTGEDDPDADPTDAQPNRPVT